MATRKEIADTLKQMVVMHFCKRNYACFVEQGVNRRGRLRADVIAMALTGHIVIIEIKSCKADFITDKKHQDYIPYCDQFYHCWPTDFGFDLPDGTGLLLPNTVGHLKVAKRAKINKMRGTTRRMLITRLAWRAGTFSKRTGVVRRRIFIK